MRPKVDYLDWGKIAYQQAWDEQSVLQKALIQQKRVNRELPEADKVEALHKLIFCEHPHVYTLGKSGSEDHLLIGAEQRAAEQIEYFKINRGGDITYHGPGQIVGYPIFDLEYFFTDVHKYVRYLEEAIIRLLAKYDILADRAEGYTGVWLPATAAVPRRKICAIGVHLSRWVTLHGFAFNVNTDLNYFKHIVPCGINDADKTVTSMAHELGEAVDYEKIKLELKAIIADLFDFEYIGKDL